MPYVDRRLPEGLQLPMLREPLRDKRIANLKHEGRVRGAKNKICRDLKEGVLTAAINVGRDGQGTDGLVGFLEDLAMHHKKMFTSLLVKVLPLNLNADVSTSSTSVSHFNIVSVPSDHYFIPKAGDGAGVSGVFEHIPPTELIAPIEREFGPQTERERQLLVELEALTSEQLLERAVDVDSV